VQMIGYWRQDIGNGHRLTPGVSRKIR
jgi:hypothetical protein